MGTTVAGQQACPRADVGTGQFQIAAALARLLTAAAAIKVAPVAMPLELGFRNIGHDVIFELAGRFQIVRTAMATGLGPNIILDGHGIGRLLGSKAAGALSVLLARAVP